MINSIMENHRRARRYAVKLPCLVKAARRGRSTAAEMEAETQDISRSGVFFLTVGEWKLGGRIECVLRFRGPGFLHPVTVKCKGTIARIVPQEGGMMGVAATIDKYHFPMRQAGASAWINQPAAFAAAS